MRVDSHWMFTRNTRAYAVLLRMFTVRRWFDSVRTSCILDAYWQSTTKRMIWKEFIISGIIDCGTPCMTRSPANWIMDCMRRTYIRAMKPLNPRLMIPTGNLAYWQDTGAPFMPSENADDDAIRHRVREAGNRAFAIIEPKLTFMRLMTNALAV